MVLLIISTCYFTTLLKATIADPQGLFYSSQPDENKWINKNIGLSRSVRHPYEEAVIAKEDLTFSESTNRETWARAEADFAASLGDDTKILTKPAPAGLTNLGGAPGTPGAPPTHKLMVGDWIAQWDPSYNAWFFYNIKTEESTWVKPKELHHVVFNSPPTPPARKVPRNVQGLANRIPVQAGYSAYPNRAAKQQKQPLFYPPQQAQEKIFESSSGAFFGFNTTTFAERGLISGIYDSLAGIYDNIVQAYVEDVYTDVIEGYTIATIKLIGWFFFGSFLILKGSVLNYLNGARSLEGHSLTESFSGRTIEDRNEVVNFTLPYLEDLQLTFPVDNSLLTCYKERNSCVNNDLPTELNQFLNNMYAVKDFFFKWLELGEKIGHMAMEGESEL